MDRITDRPDMTSAVDRGRKASTQTNKQKQWNASETTILVRLLIRLTHLKALCIHDWKFLSRHMT